MLRSVLLTFALPLFTSLPLIAQGAEHDHVFSYLENPSASNHSPSFETVKELVWDIPLYNSDQRFGGTVEGLLGLSEVFISNCTIFQQVKSDKSRSYAMVSLRNLDGNHPILDPSFEDSSVNGVMSLTKNGRSDVVTVQATRAEWGATERDLGFLEKLGATCTKNRCDQITTDNYLMFEAVKQVDVFAINEVKRSLREAISECNQ